MARTLLERAARALCRFDGLPENATQNGKPLWEDFLPEARAVIEAIREPSAAMENAWVGNSGGSSAQRDWSAMIDALLEEG